jgi:hypothetical protein
MFSCATAYTTSVASRSPSNTRTRQPSLRLPPSPSEADYRSEDLDFPSRSHSPFDDNKMAVDRGSPLMRINERGLFRRARGLPRGLCVSSEAFAAGAKVERLSETKMRVSQRAPHPRFGSARLRCKRVCQRRSRRQVSIVLVAGGFARNSPAGRIVNQALARCHVVFNFWIDLVGATSRPRRKVGLLCCRNGR